MRLRSPKPILSRKPALSEIICNTSPFQYLHQLGHLALLEQLAGNVIVPTAVVSELAEGRRRGVDVPDPAVLLPFLLRTNAVPGNPPPPSRCPIL